MVMLIASFAYSADWTFMLYLDGDNDIESSALIDFLEMSKVGSNSDLNIVVQFDRIAGYSSAYGDWSDTRRGLVNYGDIPDTSWGTSIGEINMGDPQSLINFVQWATTTYPATNYALVLWNHGDGWRRALDTDKELLFKQICSDFTDNDFLDTKELQSALGYIRSNFVTIDIVGLDACLMGMIEVAYEIRDDAAIFVASEEAIPLDGWPYDSFLQDLKTTTTMSPHTLADIMVNRYYESYGSTQAMSAVDLSLMTDLGSAVDFFAQAMREDYDTDVAAVQTAAQSVIDFLDVIILSEKHGAILPGAHGLAIYFPMTSAQFSLDYNSTVLSFAADTRWEEFLGDFYASMNGSWLYNARQDTQEFYFPEHIDLYDLCTRIIEYDPDEEYYTMTELPHEFYGGGTAQGWRDDDQVWILQLPFEFPFYRKKYSTVFVSSNGFLDFLNPDPEWENSVEELADNVRIAPLWDDMATDGTGQDIFITETQDYVIIRWFGELYAYSNEVNFEVMLYADGKIQFNYGADNQNLTPTIGISRGDGEIFILPPHNAKSSLTNASSVLFTPKPIPASYSFASDEEGWSFIGEIFGYDTALSAWNPGLIGLSPQGSTNSFSYWESTPIEIKTDRVYRVRWYVGSSCTDPDKSIHFRLRANQLGNWRAWDTVVNSFGSAAPSAENPKTYDLVVLPQQNGDSLTDSIELSFDIMSFDESNELSSWIYLNEVEVMPVLVEE